MTTNNSAFGTTEKENLKSLMALREEKTLEFWKENNVFEKTLAKSSPKGEFVFYDGPPTANGRPGIHHMEARAFKDAIPRYKTMRGYHVDRKGGWDTHGLPVELEVEKKLGLQSKKDIEKYGIAEFNNKCKESVWTYIDEWRKFTERMAYWVDIDNAYVTYKTEYIESVWNIVKIVFDKKLLYQDYRVVPWCTRCGTALSSHELAQGYKEVKDLSVYVLFKLKDVEEYILAWTTTPWTLPGNIALAVNKKITYVQINLDGKKVWLAKDRLSVIYPELTADDILAEKKGSDLAGLSYEPLYANVKASDLKHEDVSKMENAYKIYSADFVSTEDGSGVVHIAPMYGADDFALATKNNLPKVHTVDETGKFLSTVLNFAGRIAKDAETDVEVIKDLAGRGLLAKKEKVTHTYPFCWRCKTPLIYYARDSWYIRMSSLRDELISENEKINWEPSYIKEGRFGDWLREVKDWAISRERYWGTPLPIWRCGSCKNWEVLGSMDEIKEKHGSELPKNEKGEIDLHRPYIDGVTWKCSCGGEVKRVSEVMDVWFDSGAMPFAQLHYPFENKELFDGGGYPADFISEAIDQTRGWFYTLHAVGVLTGKGRAYKNVICLGHILDAQGRKMSKSLGNGVNPWDMMDKYGSDILRFWMYSVNQPGESKNFDEKTVDEAVKKVNNLLVNVLAFYEMYKGEGEEVNCLESKNVLDRWILALLNNLIIDVTKGFDTYNLIDPARAIKDFIADFSQWYIRRSRDRFKNTGSDDAKLAAATTRYVLEQISKLLAPLMPFLAEDIYQKVKIADGQVSVHLADWPVSITTSGDEIISSMKNSRQIVERALAKRSEAGIKIRQPLGTLKIKTESPLEEGLLEMIADEVNIKKVIVDNSIEGEVDLDINITPELKAEGNIREIIRFIQDLRKKNNLKVNDEIGLSVVTDSVGKNLIESFKSEVINSVRIKNIDYKDVGLDGVGEAFAVDGVSFVFDLII